MFLTIVLLVATLGLIYLFLTWNYNYWKKLGVPGPKPRIPVGTFPNLFSQKRHMAEDLDEVYRSYKKDYDFVGIYSSRSPQLLILNPQLMRRVFVTDFKCFHDNEACLMTDKKNDQILARNPFVLVGEEWKELRSEITQGLTAARIKAVYPVTTMVCERLNKYIEKEVRINPNEGTNVKDMCLRYTSEIVTDCVLGLKSDSFSDKSSPIVANIKKLFQQSFALLMYMACTTFVPMLRKVYKLRFVPKDVEVFFLDLMDKATEVRKRQLEENDPNVVGRIDFLNYLLDLQKKKGYETKDLAAHIMTFLLDGYETTAAVLTHTLYFLGRDPERQDKLLSEIKEHLNGRSEIEFDKLDNLQYLDACIHECIRVYPPGIIFNKLCTEPIELTNKNGQKLQLKPGNVAVIPAYSVMHDEDIYDYPYEFIPERFAEDPESLKKFKEMGVYYGFGDGPRVCLGMRFALTQIKAALITILPKFIVKVNPKTRRGFGIDPKYIMSQKLGGIWLDFEERISE